MRQLEITVPHINRMNGHSLGVIPMNETPAQSIARLENELATMKDQYNAQQSARNQIIANLPSQFGVETLGEVIELIRSGEVVDLEPRHKRSYHRRTKNGKPRLRAFISDVKRLKIIKAIDLKRQTKVQIAKRFGTSRQTIYAIAAKLKRERKEAGNRNPLSKVTLAPTGGQGSPVHPSATPTG